MNLKKRSVFARAHENLSAGKGNETTCYFAFMSFAITFCMEVHNPQNVEILTPLLAYAYPAVWQMTMIWSVSFHFIIVCV